MSGTLESGIHAYISLAENDRALKFFLVTDYWQISLSMICALLRIECDVVTIPSIFLIKYRVHFLRNGSGLQDELTVICKLISKEYLS